MAKKIALLVLKALLPVLIGAGGAIALSPDVRAIMEEVCYAVIPAK